MCVCSARASPPCDRGCIALRSAAGGVGARTHLCTWPSRFVLGPGDEEEEEEEEEEEKEEGGEAQGVCRTDNDRGESGRGSAPRPDASLPFPSAAPPARGPVSGARR